MADWLLQARADVDASGIAYDLSIYTVPGTAGPYDAWFIRRTVNAASALGNGVTQTVTFASFATHAALASDAAWQGRAGLIYSADLIPQNNAGNPDLLAALSVSPSSTAGGSMNAAIGTPTYLTINKDEGWVDISAAMAVDAYYQVAPLNNDVAAILAADARPTNTALTATLATTIGRGEGTEIWKFTGQPIWALTDDAQARLKITERG